MVNQKERRRVRTYWTDKGVMNIFSRVPGTYELVNHLLTWGLDVVWRKRAAGKATAGRGGVWIDCCTGTGEMAELLSAAAPKQSVVAGVDFSLPMLEQAREKSGNINLIAAGVDALPLAAGSVDLCTLSFACRNINLTREVLISRFHSLLSALRPGGRLVIVETSQPKSRLLRFLMYGYVKTVVTLLGGILSGSKPAYRYLSYTIPRFYGAEELAGLLKEAGFYRVEYQLLFFFFFFIYSSCKGL